MRNTIRNRYSFEACTSLKSFSSNACYAIGDFNTCNARAIIKRVISNACYAIRDFNTCNARAIIKRVISNVCYSIGNNNICNRIVIRKRTITYYIIFAITICWQGQFFSITQIVKQCIYIILFTEYKIILF